MKLLVEHHREVGTSVLEHCLKWSVWNDVIDVDSHRLVVFNTVSQNAVLMEKVEYHDDINDLAVATKETLYQLGFIVNAERDERAEQQKRFIQGKEDLSYLDLTILVTHNCQMRCTYCFEGNKEKIVISSDTQKAILRLLERHEQVCRRLRVTWFGGEPLLAYMQIKELTQKIRQFCQDHQISYSADITTNGYALNQQRCRELVDELLVKRFIITIDGPADIHDQRRALASGLPTFNIIWRNVNDLIDCGAWVTVRMTIDRMNRPHIPEFLHHLANSRLKGRIGLSFCRTIFINYTSDEVKSQIYNEEEWAEEEWHLIQLAHQLGLWRYQFPYASPTGGCLRRGDITIAASGLIYKCLDTVGDQRWVCGNVTEATNDTSPDWYRQWLEWTPMSNETCRRCVLQPLCNGGCPHNALYSDKKHGSSLQCQDWKPNYRKQIIEITKAYQDEEI